MTDLMIFRNWPGYSLRWSGWCCHRGTALVGPAIGLLLAARSMTAVPLWQHKPLQPRPYEWPISILPWKRSNTLRKMQQGWTARLKRPWLAMPLWWKRPQKPSQNNGSIWCHNSQRLMSQWCHNNSHVFIWNFPGDDQEWTVWFPFIQGYTNAENT